MGLIRANLKITNLFSGHAVEVDALVDTGALLLCVPETVATQLGFDVTEVEQTLVTLADGRQRHVPRIAPIRINFENRSYVTEALVLGDEPLLGVIPLEAMDLVIDPGRQMVTVNPKHPNFAALPVKEVPGTENGPGPTPSAV